MLFHCTKKLLGGWMLILMLTLQHYRRPEGRVGLLCHAFQPLPQPATLLGASSSYPYPLFSKLRSRSFNSYNKLALSSHNDEQEVHSTTTPSLSTTEYIFQQMQDKQQSSSENNGGSSGAGGMATLQGLQALERSWQALKEGSWKQPAPSIVHQIEEDYKQAPSVDVVVCGGTLGVFYALALQLRGYQVVIVERGKVKGRTQEWNISKKEMETLLQQGILTKEELQEIIAIEFNPVRVGFKTDTSSSNNPATSNDMIPTNKQQDSKSGYEFYTKDILNLGIRPNKLIDLVLKRFLQKGGIIYEDSAVQSINIHPNAAAITFTRNKQTETVVSRLVVDCMGNGSPVSRQMRAAKTKDAQPPDGICIVVGSCAKGFPTLNNTYSDVIYTDQPMSPRGQEDSYIQYFWEAFPTGGGPDERTTYLFTYLDAHPARPSILQAIMEDYWKLLPRYQGVDVDSLDFQRVLYGMFPTYRSSPLQSSFDRVIAVGDAAGIQSPLSFGGFGSMTRHLPRIVDALDEALSTKDDQLLSVPCLNEINAYLPSLSVAWMFQRAMSMPVKPSSSRIPPTQIVQTLANSFSSMERLGDAVIRPFLQDVIMFIPLWKTLIVAFLKDPLIAVKLLPQIGIYPLLDFFYHFFMLAWYTLLSKYWAPILSKLLTTASKLLPSKVNFVWRRKIEAWKFGAGLDYYHHE